MIVEVKNGDLAQALKVFKRKVGKQGILKDLKKKRFYVKPGDAKRQKHRNHLAKLARGKRRRQKFRQGRR